MQGGQKYISVIGRLEKRKLNEAGDSQWSRDKEKQGKGGIKTRGNVKRGNDREEN